MTSDAARTQMTVRTALTLPALKRGVPEVVAGRDSLDRPIRWVHAGEVPHIAAMLKGSELLLTTGMGIGRSAREQRQFVDELADRGLAALAIELGSSFDAIPEALLARAEGRSLPLVALHREVRFVEITEALHRELVNRQGRLLRRGDELHQRFTGLMLEGADVSEILDALADTIANPVVLERTGGGMIRYATHRSDAEAVLAAWSAFEHRLEDGPGTIDHPVPMRGHESWGRLVALDVDSPLDDFDEVALERAVGLIALALLRHREEEVFAARARGDFLVSLLDGVLDEREAASRARTMGLGGDPAALLGLATAPARDVRSATATEEAWAFVWRDVRRALAQRDMVLMAGTRGVDREMLVMVGAATGDRSQAAEHTTDAIRVACERHVGTRDGLVVSVGQLAATWHEASESLNAAVRALPAAVQLPPQRWHDATEPDLDRVVWALRDVEDVRSFVDARLGPLLEHDARRATKLLPTLERYCELGGRRGETARALHLERQSLYYRLGRIEELLGVDLTRGEDILGLHLALRVRRHLDR